jgi:phosphoenolpyruvate-protein phosphotransferase
MAERSVDLAEAVDAIRRALAGVGEPSSAVMDEPGVLIVDELSVAEAARLQPDLVLGIITRGGGPTGHVAIVARSLGIPAVVGVTDLSPTSYVGSRVAMDGTTGEVFIEPDSVVWADYRQRQDDYQQAIVLASRYRGTRIRCLDRELHVAANVGGPTDIELAQTQGADGIGLFRTEFLFQDRDGPPTEEEQFEIYAVAASAFSLPVVCRTFDFGGDKPISYLPLPDEENPALGLRGIRLYKEFKELFRTQVRALLRAATKGDIQILLPMVSTVDEFCEIRAEIESVRDALIADLVPVGPAVVGAMIEVPAAALCSHLLARHADFLSIGTNDLTQYTMAADRTNGSLVKYSDALHPAVFELTRLSVESAKAAGIPISVCGLSAADPIASALYVASGVDKLSVQSSQVNLVKANLAEMDVGQVVPALRQAAGCANAAELRQMAEDLVTPR